MLLHAEQSPSTSLQGSRLVKTCQGLRRAGTPALSHAATGFFKASPPRLPGQGSSTISSSTGDSTHHSHMNFLIVHRCLQPDTAPAGMGVQAMSSYTPANVGLENLVQAKIAREGSPPSRQTEVQSNVLLVVQQPGVTAWLAVAASERLAVLLHRCLSALSAAHTMGQAPLES